VFDRSETGTREIEERKEISLVLHFFSLCNTAKKCRRKNSLSIIPILPFLLTKSTYNTINLKIALSSSCDKKNLVFVEAIT
jgi:hypothetical protein